MLLFSAIVVPLSVVQLSLAISCDIQCDGKGDDTATLQAAFDQCPLEGVSVVVRAGSRCVAQPLQLRSGSELVIEGNASIAAGSPWATETDGDVAPFLSADAVTNVTVRGSGTLDGNGAAWWHKFDSRPRLLAFTRANDVRVEGVTLLNSAFWTMLLHGRGFRVSGVRVRAPFGAPNTDGIDVVADQVHIHDVDITNADDSICIKSPSSNVLVERSVVRQGNGLVIGTAADQSAWGGPTYVGKASVSNVTFRDIVADDTTFGCHIKFYFPQHGHVRNVTFERVTITQTAAAEARRVARGDWAGYAIGMHQYDQGRRLTPSEEELRADEAVWEEEALHSEMHPPGAFVSIEQITFRNITGNVQHAGEFKCGVWSHWAAPCNGVKLEHVHLNASVSGCEFEEVAGSAFDVSPASCSM